MTGLRQAPQVAGIARQGNELSIDVLTDELLQLRRRVAELEARLGSAPADLPDRSRTTTRQDSPWHADPSIQGILHTLIDMLPVGVIVCDGTGRIVLANTSAQILFDGFPAETIYDTPQNYSIHLLDGAPLASRDRPLARAIQAGEVSRDVEILVRRADGEEIVLLTSGVPVWDAAGNIVAGVASFQDISERKRAEDALRTSEARLRAILDTAVDGIITIDERGIIESLNPAALRTFGYRQEELLGQNIKVLMPSPYREQHDRYIENYCRTGWRRIIGIGREVQGLRKDGTVFPLDLAVSEVRLAGRRMFTGITRDITERKQAQEALRSLNETLEQRVFQRTAELFNANQALSQSEQRFRQFADAIPQVVWIGLPDLSQTLYVNRAYQKVWARTLDSLYADTRSVVEAVHPDDRGRLSAMLEAFGGAGRPDAVEEQFRVIQPDGQERIVMGRAFPIRNDQDEIVRVAAIFEDMTEHLRLEKEILEISEAERRRIGHDLHDTLGQTLTGVLYLVHILQQTLTDRGAAEADGAAEIVTQVTHAIQITRSLSRGLSPVELKAGGLMAGLKDLAQQAERTMGITCRFSADRPVLVHNSTAAMHLYHIAQEATNNAVKHGQATCVDIRLHGDGDRITLAIEDDGRGIPDAPNPSRGLGLRIMTYRARMIGGTLRVNRRGDRGTAVECTFRPEQAGVELP